MLIGWSPLQSSENPSQPVAYLFDDVVLKKVGNVRVEEHRAISPELLLGNMAEFSRAVHALRFKMRYRVATLSFHEEDIEIDVFNSGDKTIRSQVAAATELFLELAFAGVPQSQRPPIVIGTHTHTGRLEVNIAMPRYVLTAKGVVRSYNPHPVAQGSQNSWDSYGDFVCSAFGWKNPRHTDSLISIKGPHWVEKELAAAKRNSIEINEDQPTLFFVQEVKDIADKSVMVSEAEFQTALEKHAEDSGFDYFWRGDGRLVLEREIGGPPFELRGYLLERSETHGSIALKPHTELRDQFLDRWRRRADYNNATFGQGKWETSVPDCDATASNPSLAISHRHPDYCGHGPPTVPNKPFTTGFRSALQALGKNLIRRIAAAMLQNALRQTAVDAARRLRKHLENTDNAKPFSIARKPNSTDAGPVRPVATGLGATGQRGAGGYTEGTLERVDQYPRIDGTPNLSRGSNRAWREADRAVVDDPKSTVRRPAEHSYRYELVAQRLGATVPTRLDLIVGMRQSRSDLLGISGCPADGATFFQLANCELRHWPDGQIEIEGSIDAEMAKRLADDFAAVQQSKIAAADLQVEIYPDDEPPTFEPF